MLYKLINEALNRPYLFKIGDIEDINFFIKGCYAAQIIYKKKNPEEFKDFYMFENYINEEFKTKEKNEWSKIIKFHSKNNKESMTIFKKYILKFQEDYTWLNKNRENSNLYYKDIKKLYNNIDNFQKLLSTIKDNPDEFGFENIYNFVSFYMGYWASGDIEKDVICFQPLKDETFIGYYYKENQYIKMIKDYYNFDFDISFENLILLISSSRFEASLENIFNWNNEYYNRMT